MSGSPGEATAAPEINIQVQSPLWDVEPAAADTVRCAINAAARHCGADGEISGCSPRI